MANVDDIVRGLTKAQRADLVRGYSHTRTVAEALFRKHLTEPDRGLYHWSPTALGKLVRARLLSSSGATDHGVNE